MGGSAGDRRSHWNRIYGSAPTETRSWHEAEPVHSLRLIDSTGKGHGARILDVGGGTSFLVDRLLEAGYRSLGVLDISAVAIDGVRGRLGAKAATVEWFVEDATRFRSPHEWDVWHDRAVFHFLTEAADRASYVEALRRSLAAGGQVIIATFSPTGPQSCSGLPTVRYDSETLAQELGPGFVLRESRPETHVTPGGAAQDFLYCRFERTGR